MQASYERLASTLQYGGIGRCSVDVVKHLVCVLEEKGLIKGSLLDWDTGQLLLLCYSSSAIYTSADARFYK